MKHSPIRILRLSLFKVWSHCWVVSICQCRSGCGVVCSFSFSHHQTVISYGEIQFGTLSMEGAICSSRPCMGIYWPPSTHAQSVNSLKLRSAVALRSGGHCRCCFNSNLTQVAFELNASFSKREPVDLPTFFQKFAKIILRSKADHD